MALSNAPTLVPRTGPELRRTRAAALLLLPYLAWVSFALELNAELVRRNPRA